MSRKLYLRRRHGLVHGTLFDFTYGEKRLTGMKGLQSRMQRQQAVDL